MTEQQTPPDQPAPDQPPEQVNPFVGDEAEFCRSLGIDPNLVVSGSIGIEIRQGGIPHIVFRAVQPVTPHALGLAFLRSAPAEPPQQQAPPQDATVLPMPQDHQPPGPRRAAQRKPAKKAPAKKAAAKKAAPKPEASQ